MTRRTPRTPRGRRAPKRFGLFVVFALLLAAIIIIAPKEPTKQALNIDAQGNQVPVHEGLVISEVMSANSSAYPDENGNFADWLELGTVLTTT